MDLRRPQNKVRRHRVRPSLLSVPFRMDSEAEEPSKRLIDEIHDLAAYATDYIDVSPMSGRLLLAALAYPHVRAYAICTRKIEYRYLTAMRDFFEQIYGRVSIFMLEYFALGTADRRAYFYEKIAVHDSMINGDDDVEFIALALFLCSVSAGGVYSCNSDGCFVGTHGRKKYPPTELEYDNFRAIASALSSAEIFLASEQPFILTADDSFMLLHASKSQRADGQFGHYFKIANRVLLDEEN